MLDTERMFHPVVASWLERKFGAPTPAQAQAWPLIAAGKDVLVTAPTGSGKTLAAFLWALDSLIGEAIAAGGALPDRTSVLYVSPLKALSNDIRRNLEEPLAELRALAVELGYPAPDVRTAVRTGDTTARERREAARRPPQVLVTTPESLFILLTSESGRRALRDVRTVIVDEIHAVAADKRGAHLALSLERLQALTAPHGLQRVGLSATVRPLDVASRLLVGTRPSPAVVDVGQRRDLDLGVEVPEDELGAVCTNEQWVELYDRIAALARAHRSTLVFVNTRRLVERVTLHLGERLGAEAVAAHHGSLSRERRHRAERRLKEGDLRVVVATASLELGIDVGAVELTCLIGSPRSISTGLQRIGRSGHALRATPKGRLFPLTRDQLVECAALVRAARRAEIDAVRLRDAPLDVLAQQIVAATACEDWDEDALFALCRTAAQYAELDRRDFDAVVDMLSEGIATSRGRAGAMVHRDAVNRRLRGRRGARLAALTSGGAIPDNANYDVVLEPEGTVIGNIDEDFAIESMAGDIILLGNASWRIRRVEPGRVRVEDAAGAPPTIPFWLGEGPARTRELSAEVAALREEIAGVGRARRGRGAGADDRVCARPARRRAAARLRRRRRDGAGRRADADARGGGALLRRRGRHAAGHPRAVRRPHQPRVGHGAAQALLPFVRLRAAGGGHRRRHRAVAGAAAQLPARHGVLDAARRRRRGAAGPGRAAGADVRDALALERDAVAGAAAHARRQARAAGAAAHARAGPDRRGVPGADRLPGQPRRRGDRDPRPPAGARDRARLPGRGDGRGGAARRADGDARRADRDGRVRAPGAVGVRARDPQRQPVRVSGRRAAGGTADARGQRAARAARERRRARGRAGPGGGRRGGRGGRARSARRRRAARSAARSRRAARGDRRGARLAGSVRGADRRPAGGPPARGGPAGSLGRGRAPLGGGGGLAGAPLRPRAGRAAVAARRPRRCGGGAGRDRARSRRAAGTDDVGTHRRAAGRARVRRRGGAGAAGDGGQRAARAVPHRGRRPEPVV